MRTTKFLPALVGIACGALTAAAVAAPVTYTIDSRHTFPAFRADHNGMSTFTGRINGTTGTIVLDTEAGTGTVDITMDMNTVDFGIDALDTHVKGPDMFDTAQFPTATYTGKLVDFKDGAPTAVDGTLTFHGVSKPVRLTVERFNCGTRMNRQVCGADVTGSFERDEFGVAYGGDAFDKTVTLIIQVEAAAAAS